ncbi:MAG TPA: 50S ribosomal protein L15 [Candidatus Saccharimonadales bacterium]|jgi:large subunit ribosomal protein L15|nr:50S ribosomal protein L15 [Candidatus Saccharimonadales bacterium]
MKYHELNAASNKQPNRVGRGIAAGQGKTAGRGTKGQNSRTGSSRKPGFEGGSNPLMQRMPKLPGFKSHKVRPEVVYTGQLDNLKAKIINNKTIFEAGLIGSANSRVKLIVKGKVTKQLTVELQLSSKQATEMISKAGGSVKLIPQQERIKLVKS